MTGNIKQAIEKELMILVGPIGVGKTTFGKTLENDTSIRISQDEMGKPEYLNVFHQSIEEGVPRIIIDRMNFNMEQRKRFIEPARKQGYIITIFDFEWDWDTCFNRVVKRFNHPTVPAGNPKLTEKILHFYQGSYQKPTEAEYDNYNVVELDK